MSKSDGPDYALPLENVDEINRHAAHIRAVANLIELADKGLATNELDQGTLSWIGEDVRHRAEAIRELTRGEGQGDG